MSRSPTSRRWLKPSSSSRPCRCPRQKYAQFSVTRSLDSKYRAWLHPATMPGRTFMKFKSAPTGLTKKKSAGGVVDTVKTVVYAVLIALVVRTVAYEPFNIPSGSMVPTLLVGDYFFVSSVFYGSSSSSFPFAFASFFKRMFFGQPHRGDVVVFNLPTDNSTDFIKRVIGL